MGCNHAINTVRCVIEQLTKAGNTVNLCAIDLSKALIKSIIMRYTDKIDEKKITCNLVRATRELVAELLLVY